MVCGYMVSADVFKDPTVIAVAKMHSVSPAQVALRWLVQQNITIVTARPLSP
jgi:diketogulonate reductase-like aldo/keto reductase